MMGQSGRLESFSCRKAVAQLTEHCIKCMTGTVVVIPAQAGIQVASARSGVAIGFPPSRERQCTCTASFVTQLCNSQ